MLIDLSCLTRVLVETRHFVGKCSKILYLQFYILVLMYQCVDSSLVICRDTVTEGASKSNGEN
jgi:hypothetical protein